MKICRARHFRTQLPHPGDDRFFMTPPANPNRHERRVAAAVARRNRKRK